MRGARVKVAATAPIGLECMPISNVDAEADSKDAAEILLRDRAGAMNATHVVVSETVQNAGQVKLIGKALGCK